MSDYGRSVVRTVVPLIVGTIVGWLATRGVEVDRASLIAVVDPIVAAIYYALVRVIERRVPSFGWLLGVPGAPSYAVPAVEPPGSDANPF